jgi:hypothetical protein
MKQVKKAPKSYRNFLIFPDVNGYKCPYFGIRNSSIEEIKQRIDGAMPLLRLNGWR